MCANLAGIVSASKHSVWMNRWQANSVCLSLDLLASQDTNMKRDKEQTLQETRDEQWQWCHCSYRSRSQDMTINPNFIIIYLPFCMSCCYRVTDFLILQVHTCITENLRRYEMNSNPLKPKKNLAANSIRHEQPISLFTSSAENQQLWITMNMHFFLLNWGT